MPQDAPHNTHRCWATDQTVFFYVTGNTLSTACGTLQGSVVSFGSVPKSNARAHKEGTGDRHKKNYFELLPYTGLQWRSG
jgi:hypothetical protein